MSPSDLAAEIVSALKHDQVQAARSMSIRLASVLGQMISNENAESNLDLIRSIHSSLHNSVAVARHKISLMQNSFQRKAISVGDINDLLSITSLDASLRTSLEIVAGFLIARA